MSKRLRKSVRSKSRSRRRNRTRKHTRNYTGGGTLPIPRGSVAIMSLDPTDKYGVPVAVSKEMAEEQILNT